MVEMNYFRGYWVMQDDLCPCDNHFNEWIEAEGITGKTIYHLGTGTHHIIGQTQSQNESRNRVFAITASKEEYEAYMDLVTENPRVAKTYVCYFGDIYLTKPELLPDFDVVTMFHICEFFFPNTASKEYGGLTDPKVLDLFTAKTRKGGYILFYKHSMGFHKLEKWLPKWEKKAPVKRVGEFKTLIVYKKK